ncbi:bifunctional molybdenum cofactor guanylyltransferase MobA/molybdopterin-guanine dinucleotide biosynthesis adaptor protein MobB [Ammonifex thiophilus]|uniref:bifunctional molybdenum cofactor guanylyltransferase MobA/molybdopterin-guanine dinucleotide biosynthesis adaptor protein MobB n=1 Tax=Ammonifex thiophilus TaxID=444093 RepID=UPI001401F48C|nr:bifunctional molybdenum cofactor guanylyltransferase MobA/molybdopterin-guanine dinucleotide biosynthesis adaptor protein MobB [Ammonifex thiophilus]
MVEATGVVLAGGKSTRLGRNKAFLECEGEPLITRVVNSLRRVFPEVIVVGDPELYGGLADRVVSDIFPGAGPLAGIHAGLVHAFHEVIFVSACDLPFVNEKLALGITRYIEGYDAAIPCVGGRLEPLFAAYRRTCLGPATRCLQQGRRKVVSFIGEIKVRYLTEVDLAGLSPDWGRTFFNLNWDYELGLLRAGLPLNVPVVGVIGPSGSGKTTLIAGLIQELSSRGYRVAAVKHTGHRLEDIPGKDTARLAAAGAKVTVLLGPGGFFYFRSGEGEVAPFKVFCLLEGEADIILVEGYKHLALPRIVIGEGVASGGVLAYLKPGFSPEEIKRLAKSLEEKFLKRRYSS